MQVRRFAPWLIAAIFLIAFTVYAQAGRNISGTYEQDAGGSKANLTIALISGNKYRLEVPGEAGWKGEGTLTDRRLWVNFSTSDGGRGNLDVIFDPEFTKGTGIIAIESSNTVFRADVVIRKVGGAPPTATGGGTAVNSALKEGGLPAGHPLSQRQPDENVIGDFGLPKFKAGPLPLPKVGAGRAPTGKTMPLRMIAPGAVQKGKVEAVEIKKLTATHVPDRNGPERYAGRIQVDVELTGVGASYEVDLYVGGYLAPPPNGIGGIKNIGRTPAYLRMNVGRWANNQHPQQDKYRRYTFPMPRVLPATIRAELWQIGKANKLVGKKEVVFDMPFPDHGCIHGQIFGRERTDEQGRVLVTITKVIAFVQPETTQVNVTIPGVVRPQGEPWANDWSKWVDFNLAESGQDSFGLNLSQQAKWEGKSERVKDSLAWNQLRINVEPGFRDRDHRNNTYWPNLPNKGYVDGPPVPTTF